MLNINLIAALLSLTAIIVAEPAHAVSKHALLIGVSDYPEEGDFPIGKLEGPRNDVLLMRSTLLSFWGDDAEIVVLADSLDRSAYDDSNITAASPTRQNILDALDVLAKKVAQGDDVIVYFSGHGSQLPAASLFNDEIDGLDETILPIDAKIQTDDNAYVVENHLRDNALSDALRLVINRGASVWLIVDACHSGTIDRNSDLDRRQRYFRFPPSSQSKVIDLNLGPEKSAQLESKGMSADGFDILVDSAGDGNFVGFFAAEEHAVAEEIPFRRSDGPDDLVQHGVMTWTLVQALLTGGGETYATVAARVRNDMHQVNFGSSKPQFVGALDTAFMLPWTFSQSFSVSVTDTGMDLLAGRLHGIVPETIVDVFGNRSQDHIPLFSAEVIDAGLDTSSLRIIENSPVYPSRISKLAATAGLTYEEWLDSHANKMTANVNQQPLDFVFRIARPPRNQTESPHFQEVIQLVEDAVSEMSRDMNALILKLVASDEPADLQLWLEANRLWFAPANTGPEVDGNQRSPSLSITALNKRDIQASLAQIARARNIFSVAAEIEYTRLARYIDMAVYVDAGVYDPDSKSCILPSLQLERLDQAAARFAGSYKESLSAPIVVPLCSRVYIVFENTGHNVVDVSPFYFDQHGNISNINDYLIDGKVDGARMVLKLFPGDRRIASFPEGIQKGTDLSDVLLGEYRLVSFLSKANPEERYSRKTLKFITGTSPATYPQRSDVEDLVGFVNIAGYFRSTDYVVREGRIEMTSGARIIAVYLVEPEMKR